MGWVDGRNIRVDYRWGAGSVDRVRLFAKELVGLNPDVLVGITTPATAALQSETKTVPIVFAMVSDPLGSGLVASFARPGGNITGFVNIEASFFPILLTTVRGFREVEPELLELIRSLRASKWQTFAKIQLPSALPYIFSGMKVGAILAVAGAIVGEFLGSSRGLGYLMLQVQATLDTAAMFMAVLLITGIGVVLYGLVLGLERLVIVRDARIR